MCLILDSILLELSKCNSPENCMAAQSTARDLFLSLQSLFFSRLPILFEASFSSKNLLTFFLSMNLVSKLDALEGFGSRGIRVVFPEDETSSETGGSLPLGFGTEYHQLDDLLPNRVDFMLDV